jgi:diguanylate cyclase (GGDEF)-like protein
VAGDKVLQKISKLLQGAVRGTDTLARYGGDEFVVLLPDTSEENALHIAEKLRAALADDPELKDFGVTGSFGVCSSDVSAADDSENFIKHADEAAYLSKRAGGNKVEAYK